MKRQGAIGAAVTAMALASVCLLYGYFQEPAVAGAEFATWPPSADAIRGKIGTAAKPVPGMTENERREQFCEMFKNRYRHHDPAVAIGIRFLTPTRVKLMGPARLEPFFVDQIALAAWREARENFGKSVDIDIYDTFIGTTQIKIGELRACVGDPKMAHIVFDFTELEILNRPRSAVPINTKPGKALDLPAQPPRQFRPMNRPGL